MNSEGFTVESVKDSEVIGVLRNNWRQRLVKVYNHPNDPAKVISVGFPFGGGQPVVCVEDRQPYLRTISLFPKTAVYD